MVFNNKTTVWIVIIGIVGALLQVSAIELPRARLNRKKMFRSLLPTLVPVREPYNDNRHFRKSRNPKIFIIQVDPDSQLLKKLEKIIPIKEESEEKYDSSLLVQKPLAMLPLVNYGTNDNDIDSYKKRADVKEIDEVALSNIFDKNGMVYLTKPYNQNNRKSKKNALRIDVDDTKLDVLNRILNNRLEYERQKPAPEAQVYQFSDLVL